MNRLGLETSPYLLQHAENPVDWYPWGSEAFDRAKAEDKPILLSIGYMACHWCHVMERESFEDQATADLMNEHFVCIKVDREERPDVDSVYMDAVVSLSGHGGWPMTVFLTPDAKPFYGGTYFPPESRHGLPGFKRVLESLSTTWREKRGDVEEAATGLSEYLQAAAAVTGAPGVPERAVLDSAAAALREGFDYVWGGWGRAPKFPPACTLEFLLRRDERELTRLTLDGMAAGGMYDVVGGGFHRYSVDERWLVPHFEKMLYDNAQLAVAYLHGWQVHKAERYREIVEETIGYMLRELALPGGGFASAQDADTDGVEGLTFTWAPGEGAPEKLLEPFEHGRSVIRGRLEPEQRQELFALRELRPKPALDDKAVASWNGLALAALAECGRVLERPEWIDAARHVASFLLGPMSSNGRLRRTFRDGVGKGSGYLEDYADVANGMLELHVATGEIRWLNEAHRLATRAVELFGDDEGGGFFHTASDAERLVARKKTFDDHPVPSGNAMLAYVLVRLSRIYGDAGFEERAAGVFRLLAKGLEAAPTAYGFGLVALDLYLSPSREIAIIGPNLSPIAKAALATWDPRAVIAFGPADGVPLLEGKTLVDGEPAVYICERFSCQAPITAPSALTGI